MIYSTMPERGQLCGKALTWQRSLLVFERPAYKFGPWLASGNLDSGWVPNTLMRPTGPRMCTNNVVYAEHLLSAWESEALVHARQRVSM